MVIQDRPDDGEMEEHTERGHQEDRRGASEDERPAESGGEDEL